MSEQCGTPAYIAPEIISEQGYKGFKSDMWSAGVCLYVMLVGTVPFRAGSMKELHKMIMKGKYDFQGETVSSQAKDLLSKLMCGNVKKRYCAEDALKHPWLLKTDTGGKIDTDRPDLADIIFTPKEIDTIQKEYISRLEKLKRQQTKQKNVEIKKNNFFQQNYPAETTDYGYLKDMTEDDLLFTEHDLDTKEDQESQVYKNTFKGKKDNDFQKFEGFNVKKHDVSKESDIQNRSEKSIIFAPFNSSFSDFDEDHPEKCPWPSHVLNMLQPKRSRIIKFSKKCRDLNREYESNNNADLDNGVYNAFVNEQE